MEFPKNKELSLINVKRNTLTKLQSELKDLEVRLQSKKKEDKKCKRILEKERQEYKDIHGLSLTSLFYTIIGSKAEKLEKEKQEYLLAKLNYDKLQEEIELIDDRKNEISREIEELGNVEDVYQQLLNEKQEYLFGLNDAKADAIHGLVDKQLVIDIKVKEIDEAGVAAGVVMRQLDQVISKLNSAKNWGTYDMVGGGVIASAMKHSKIDEAKRLISRTQFDIDRLIKELKDVDMHLHIKNSIDISGFETFADFFFDGLIFDYMVQKKIVRSRTHIRSIHRKVSLIRSRLLEDKKKLVAERESLEQERELLLNK
ncbi:hypothetical protein EYV94_01995 [Puteibacter caeruleilacunae]|nr:hypothetical protein EYV94_01995 [Puteibacter caeruleilacunae]